MTALVNRPLHSDTLDRDADRPPRSQQDPRTLTPTQLLDGVRRGDAQIWREVERRYVRLLWTVINGCRLSQPDAQDVIQTTWIKLIENAGRIREPENLHQWLAVTARRESWRVGSRAHLARELFDGELPQERAADTEPVDADLLRREDAQRLWAAVDQLPLVQQRVVRALAADDEPSYNDVAAILGMPRGGLGPTRNRALKTLRLLLADEPGRGGPTHCARASRPAHPAVALAAS